MVKVAMWNKLILALNNPVMMGLGQDQHHHPGVHTEGVSRGGSMAVAVSVSDICTVTGYT